MLIEINARTKAIQANLFPDIFNLLLIKKKYPIAKFNIAQSKFTIGVESPFPGGFENGVGKAFPEIPLMKWGSAFAINIPAKKPNR